MRIEQNNKRNSISLKWSVSIGCIIFIAILCSLLTVASYNISKVVLYKRYREQMTSIVDVAESYLDKDDLYLCAQELSDRGSEKYAKASEYFDQFVTYYGDLHYLYILQAYPESSSFNVVSILSGNSDEDKAHDANLPEGDDPWCVYIGDGGDDWYTEETAQQLKSITEGDKDVFFFEDSYGGKDYTLARPLITSDGKHFALLCVDVSCAAINASLTKIVWISIAITVSVGFVLTAVLVFWMLVFFTLPAKKLQNSVTAFANQTHGRRDPRDLEFNAPDKLGSLELQSLSDSIQKMSDDMKDYLVGMLRSEQQAKEMDVVAHRDALTGVKNKAAYDKEAVKINGSIRNGTAKFAILMSDINDLKGINDNYGHECGDIYIVGACDIICATFVHSMVFRIGGDEIVVLLEGKDYDNRDKLIQELRAKFEKSSTNQNVKEFERFSAAVGMAVYQKGVDKDVDCVFQRADKDMYADKARMKSK